MTRRMASRCCRFWLGFLVTLTSGPVRTTLARRRLPDEVIGGVVHDHYQDPTARDLIGTPVDVPVPQGPDDHLVHTLPLLDDNDFPTDHWAGLLPASAQGDKYFFYWLFAPHDNHDHSDVEEKDIPLLIWLNGGPACSSMDGLWLENGPFRLVQNEPNKDWKITLDEYSWHQAPAYVLYIDQPVGTGLSFTTSGKYPTNDEEVNVDFYYFLQEFLRLHGDNFLNPAKTKMTRPLYFSGESHAGHYIPSMMNYIQRQNHKPNVKLEIPLSGAAIGNGWIDPMVQYSAQDVAYGYGMIGRAQQRALAEQEVLCQQDLKKGKYVSNKCFGLLDQVVDHAQGTGSPYRVSQYDQRIPELKHQPRDFPPGHKDVEAYLGGSRLGVNYKDVLEAIHATPSDKAHQRYQECTDPPYNALKHQDGLGVVPDVVALLNAGVTLLFFNGIHDLICNHVGNEIAVERFPWDHQSDYVVAERFAWTSPSTGQLAGYLKEFQNLKYLKVLNAGHMVPMDVPDVSLDLIRAMVFGASMSTYGQGLPRSRETRGEHCPVCPEPVVVVGGEDDNASSCPECPACLAPRSSDSDDGGSDTTTKEQESSVKAQETGGPWMGLWVIVTVVSCIGGVCLSQWYQSRQTTSAYAAAVYAKANANSNGQLPPQQHDFEMELPTSSFRDEPQDEQDLRELNGDL